MTWQTWADVPDEVKAQLLQVPLRTPLQLAADDSFDEALGKIIAARTMT